MIQYPNVMIMIISIFTIMIMISMRTTKVRILADSNKHLKLHAAESLSKLAKYKKVFADFMVNWWWTIWSIMTLMIITIMTNNTPNSHHTYLLSSLNCNKPIVLFKKCHFSRIELQHQAKWYWKMAICLIRVTKKKPQNTNKANTGEKDCEKEQRDPKGGWPPRCRHEQGADHDHDDVDDG